jgi:hypothetical protein
MILPYGEQACSVTGSWKLESCLQLVAAFVFILFILLAVGLSEGKKQYDDKNEEDKKAGIDISGRQSYEQDSMFILRIIGTICMFLIALVLFIWSRCGNSKTPMHKAK